MGSPRGALVRGARHRRAGVIRLLLFLGGALALYQFARTQKEAELPRIVYDLDEASRWTVVAVEGITILLDLLFVVRHEVLVEVLRA